LRFRGLLLRNKRRKEIAEALFLDLGAGFSVGLRGIHAKAGKQQDHGCAAVRKFG
jgi:hypothetical protein